MIIAVASGKGGTGKTTVATNLAYLLGQKGEPVAYFDCDVEEPNGHLFLKPGIAVRREIGVPVPEIDQEKCTGCGLCGEICQYSAIACVNKKIITFPNLCHSCGGCVRVCPVQAITEKTRMVGVLEAGKSGDVKFTHGILRIGEVMSPPLIKEVKAGIKKDMINIIDVPPGTSCPVITAVRSADFVILVTEPTPFGLHDLKLALDMTEELGLPRGIVVNRHEVDNDRARNFCKERGVPILAEIPDDRAIAESYSKGDLILKALPAYKAIYQEIWQQINIEMENQKGFYDIRVVAGKPGR